MRMPLLLVVALLALLSVLATPAVQATETDQFTLSHLMTACPTIRLYGIDLGTDKIGHIFQQGFEYLTRYEDALDGGTDEATAIAGAVHYGVRTELGLYGILLTGVYSNGDLAGNYAGFKFFRN